MKVILIETHNENDVEWGLSFSDPNPEPEDYFKMVDKETATRLCDKLKKSPSVIEGDGPTRRMTHRKDNIFI